MKLYYSPGACSLAPHIAALELGLQFELMRVDLATKKTQDKNYLEISPKGYVPAWEIKPGEVLTEAAIILQYLADQVPAKNMIPRCGTMERYRVQEWLHFVSTEIHKNYSGIFSKGFSEETKEIFKANLKRRYEFVEKQLEGREFLMGSQFTVADIYLFVVTSWATFLKVDLSAFKNVLGFMERTKSRPAVQSALKAEGLGGK